MKTWKEICDEKIREQAAAFTARQVAAGRISPDSIAAMSGTDLRTVLTTSAPVAEPTEAERKAVESAEREQGLRFNHAMGKPASELDASDRQTLRDAVTAWLRGNR